MLILETLRFLVRQFVPEDAEALYSVFSNPDVTRWMGDGKPLTYELCAKWITVSQRNYETRGFGASAVIEKSTGAFVGCCGIVYDADRNEPEIIYGFDPRWWGQGAASEIVPAMLDYGLNHCGLEYILATIDSANQASQRVAEKAGMRLEREEREPDGSVTLVYILEAERGE